MYRHTTHSLWAAPHRNEAGGSHQNRHRHRSLLQRSQIVAIVEGRGQKQIDCLVHKADRIEHGSVFRDHHCPFAGIGVLSCILLIPQTHQGALNQIVFGYRGWGTS